MTANEMNDKLRSIYANWLNEIRVDDSAGFLEGNTFSNPYFIDVLPNWENVNYNKIMFVGEEGTNSWGKDMTGSNLAPIIYSDGDVDGYIKRLQEYQRALICTQLELPYAHEKGYNFTKNQGAFWGTIRRFAGENTAIITNNGDKFNKFTRTRCNLSHKERAELHKYTDLLTQEIEITDPTHIVFLGWHEVSISKFLDIYANRSEFKKKKKEKFPIFSGVTVGMSKPCCFTYHPQSMLWNKYSLDEYAKEIRKILGLAEGV